MTILRSGPTVIHLGLSTNELSSYQRKRWAVGRAEDLLQVILGDPGRQAAEASAP